ncbi:MAG: GNAT family N-acetyltransferase [Candidatus Competibacteraceae bacterium]|jgi:GNAT superfamily N-acetyltransferase|nr:GNAT family N-acetyltransferase [Candidatus Competibacteraceae bacterium]
MSAVTIYYLEMRSLEELKPAHCRADPPMIMECQIKQFQLNQFLYRFIGTPWQWTDKASWTDTQWRSYAESDQLRTFVAYQAGAIAGYYELQRQADAVEISYFGLTEPFIGHGYGGYLLTCAVRDAWSWEARRVWVHTCTLDHPAALLNYQKRGFTLYQQETFTTG